MRIETINGSNKVISHKNKDGVLWQSFLVINNGEDVTPKRAAHSTKESAIRWAKKILK